MKKRQKAGIEAYCLSDAINDTPAKTSAVKEKKERKS